MSFITEDMARDSLREQMGLFDGVDFKAGVGQQTTFKQLGFNDKDINMLRPDGWYLPNDTNEVAIVCEIKNSKEDVNDNIEQVLKYIRACSIKYKKTVGIIYNGVDIAVFANEKRIDIKNKLFKKEYYLKLFNKDTIDKNAIYRTTKKINDTLHFKFGIKNLNHRMVFTACSLVSKRYGAVLLEGMNFPTLRQSIISTINTSYANALNQNTKLNLLGDCFSEIKFNFVENQEAIDVFIKSIDDISEYINSDYWNGEDVMAIFFNEFNRYKKKSESGQVFTPDHITSLMYRITGTSYKDNVLDACCGSGAFLVKAMSNMIEEVGGVNAIEECKEIKTNKLYGIEIDKELFALSCANMLIHKDGKTNLNQGDSTTSSIGDWIKSKKITKVLMNPPYERKYGCLDIVKNVLDNVENNTICAFILPDTKLKVNKKNVNNWLKSHSLLKIIKLPDEIFSGLASISTSIFIFKAHEPQKEKEIFACWIKEDGLQTLKNQGRHDVDKNWKDIENYWVNVIYKQAGDDSIQWLNPNEFLNYQIPANKFLMQEKDFKETIIKHILFENNIDELEFKKSLFDSLLSENPYDNINYEKLSDMLKEKTINDAIKKVKWGKFKLTEIFDISTGATIKTSEKLDGETPRISVTAYNNGIQEHFADVDNKNYRVNENFISFSFLGTCFYHPYKASLDMKVHALKPKENTFDLNMYVGIFMVSVLKVLFSAKQSFIDQMSSTDLKEENIYLPVKDDGSIDLGFMEEYITIKYNKMSQIIN